LIVLDTHVLVWWLAGEPSLSRPASQAISRGVKEGGIVASAISVLEIVTAARCGRLQLTMPVEQWLDDVRQLPELRFEPVSDRIARIAGAFGEGMHGDPADRIIAATALVLGAILVSADDRLRANRAVKSLW
jgi:PIN domain nuclease of toxin-antitoxin system